MVPEPFSLKHARTVLCVPGHRADYFSKAQASGADVLMYDLEDGVPLALREEAFARVREVDLSASLLRVTPDSWQSDRVLDLARSAGAVVIPKLKAPSQAAIWLDSGVERWALLVETPNILFFMRDLLEWGCRLPLGILLGAADLRASFGSMDLKSLAVQHVRCQVAILAAALGVPAIDSPAERPELVLDEAADAYGMGFTGKGVLSPSDIAHVRFVFGLGEAIASATLTHRDLSPGRTPGGELIAPPTIAAAERYLGIQ